MSPSIDPAAMAALQVHDKTHAASDIKKIKKSKDKKEKKDKTDKKEKKDKKDKDKKSKRSHRESASGSEDSEPEVSERPAKKVHTEEASDAATAPGSAASDDGDNELSVNNFALSDETKSALRSRGIEALFPIQASTLQPILDGFDVLGRARTGTGKTLAFSLPMIENLLKS
ncbi:hypothetical protein H4R21_006278, partial [Coemansia helicoidea]